MRIRAASVSRHPDGGSARAGFRSDYAKRDDSRSGYFGLSFSSPSVALVRSASLRSAPLPAWCAICDKVIAEYPFITKHGNYRTYRMAHRRVYHLACAMSIGLVSFVPMEA